MSKTKILLKMFAPRRIYQFCFVFLMFVAFLLTGFPTWKTSSAAQDILHADHVYQMGDNDSKNDARNYCLLEAKKKLIEKAGVYVESRTEVRNFQLEKSEIRSVSAAVIQIETARDEVINDKGKMAMSCAVRTSVNVEAIRKQLARYRDDDELRSKVREQQAKLQSLEQELSKLRASIASSSANDAARFRSQANAVVSSIDRIEESRRQIVAEVRRVTNLAWQNVEIGMTEGETITVAGQPRSKSSCSYDKDKVGFNYGQIWVLFKNGVATCFVDTSLFAGSCFDCNHHKNIGAIRQRK